MGNSRVWLFRGLVIVAAGLMVVSFILPWWSVSATQVGENVVRIYPYGLGHSLGSLALYIAGAEMPVWFAPLMWIYLAASVGLLLYSTWLVGKRGKLLVGGVGLSYILVAVVAIIVAAIRTGDYGMSLLGPGYISMGPEMGTGVDATLRFGYFMAYGVGLLCIALALLRNKIIGKPKLNA